MHTTGKCRGHYLALAGSRLPYSMKQRNLTWTWQTLKHTMGECFGWVCMPLPSTFSFQWHCFCNSCIRVLMHISDSNLNTLLNYQCHFYFGCYAAIISVLAEQNNTQLWLLTHGLFPSYFQQKNYILQCSDFPTLFFIFLPQTNKWYRFAVEKTKSKKSIQVLVKRLEKGLWLALLSWKFIVPS